MKNETQQAQPTDERIMQDRVVKIDALRDAGINPYPNKFETSATCDELQARYLNLNTDEFAPETHRVAGRVMARRGQGNVMFIDLQDRSGKIQVLISKRDYTGDYKAFQKLLDYGDYVGFEGQPTRTARGELSIKATAATLLSKCLRPLPPTEQKGGGFVNQENRRANRHIDLLINEETRQVFKTRSTMIKSVRNFFEENDALEVETPLLQENYGGAAATPFVTQMEALDGQKMYLRIAPELYLKRLLIGGLERVFEIGKNFRNENLSGRHNPEFTMVEGYFAYWDYQDMMDFTQKMLQKACLDATGSYSTTYNNDLIDFSKPFARKSLVGAIKDETGLDVMDISADEIRAFLDGKGIDTSKDFSWAQLVDHAFSHFVEHKLVQPTFIYDYPVELSPFARQSDTDPRFTERFELIIGRQEIANAYSELVDPKEQALRFKVQRAMHEAGDATAATGQDNYVAALQTGCPPAAGLGVGLDRLAMILTNQTSIRDVILFPTRRVSDE